MQDTRKTFPTSAELIREHSQARVRHPSRKPLVIGADPLTGLPRFGRQMVDSDVREALAKKYR